MVEVNDSMPYSKLSGYVDMSSDNFNENRTWWTQSAGQYLSTRYGVSRITIHHAGGVAEGITGLQRMGTVLHDTSRQTSWNYSISSDGIIGAYVDEAHRAWTTGSPENDYRAITMEVCNEGWSADAFNYNWPISKKTLDAVIDLCEDICRRYGFRKLVFDKSDREKIANGTFDGDRDAAVNKVCHITVHRWYAQTGCPGPDFYGTDTDKKGKLYTVCEEVNRRLKQASTLSRKYVKNPIVVSNKHYSGGSGELEVNSVLSNNLIQTSAGSVSSGSTGQIASGDGIDPHTIDVSNLSPYVITLSKTFSGKLSATQLREAGVSAALIEAGQKYDSNRIKQDTFISKNLKRHVDFCTASDIAYGLYVESNVISTLEAQEECEDLQVVVRKHSPKLGIWIKPNWSRNITVNDKILDTYGKYFTQWGLSSRMGVICSKQNLKTITWAKHHDQWYLWIDDKVKVIPGKQAEMEPEFFEIGDVEK